MVTMRGGEVEEKILEDPFYSFRKYTLKTSFRKYTLQTRREPGIACLLRIQAAVKGMMLNRARAQEEKSLGRKKLWGEERVRQK